MPNHNLYFVLVRVSVSLGVLVRLSVKLRRKLGEKFKCQQVGYQLFLNCLMVEAITRRLHWTGFGCCAAAETLLPAKQV